MTPINAVPANSGSTRHRQVLGAFVVAVLAAGLWFAWMGWDSTYQTDPVTHEVSGPYQAWQVIGCGVSLIILLVGALLLKVRPIVACSALTVAFTAAWTVTAAARDDSGLFVVGAFLLFVGLALGCALVSLLVRWLMRHGNPRSS